MKYPQLYAQVQKKKSVSRQPVFLTDSDYDFILEEIGWREKSSLKEM